MILFKRFVEVPYEFIARFGFKDIVTYNLNSLIHGFNELSNLAAIPYCEYAYDEVEFDVAYSNRIISDDTAFLELMTVIMDVYNNPDRLVQILIGSSPCRDCITENLIKIIQQRYGLNAYIVNDVSDLDAITDEPDFSADGLVMIGKDMNRYSSIVGSITGELEHVSE